MSDFDLPELPSDEELGITDEDREAYAEELGDDAPEMSEEEMRALLGDVPAAKASESEGPSRKDARAARRAEKKRQKEARKRDKAARKQEAAAKSADQPAESDGERAARIARAAGGAPAAGGAAGRGKGDASGGGGPPKKEARPARPAAAGPRSRWRGPLTLAFLLGVAWVASSRTLLPRPLPANAPDTVFSSARAMSTLIEIAARPHPPGSPDHARVRDLLLERLGSLGLDPEVQTTTSMIRLGANVRTATVRNIVARVPGTDPTGAVLLTAHYDGRGISVAASDDGVGVATIVESVRALQVGGALRNDVIVLITDGEELGLLGARAFVDEHEWLDDVSVVVSVEMRGGGGPSIMFETNELNGWVIRALKEFDPRPFATSLAYEVYRRMPNDTDFTPFKEAGKQGLNFAAIDNAHVYHQAYDEPQALDESTLQHHGIHALAAVRHLARADLTEVNDENVVYFSLPIFGLVVYDASWVLGVSALLLLALAGSFFGARRGGARPIGIAAGIGVAVLAGAVTWGASFAVVGWIPRFHPEAGSLVGSLYHREGWYMVALAAIAFASLSAVYPLARRWLTAPELGVGAAVVPALLAIVVGFAAPLGAMTLQWPVIAALASISLVALLADRSHGVVAWVATLLLTVPVLFMLQPLAELVWLALTLRLGAWLSLLALLPLLLCLPALESLRQPNSWWAPLLGVGVAAGSVGLGIVGARPSDTRPAPSTLVYAYEHGTGSAVWATDGAADSLDAAALAWAREKAGGSFDGTRDLSRFAYGPGQAPTIPASVATAQPPEVVLQRDSIDGATRRVTLRVRSRIGAEYLAFTYDDSGSTRITSINGKPVSDPGDVRWIDHWGEPDPAVVLALEMPADEPIGLHVIEHLLRPAEILGSTVFERPPELAPDVTRQSDRAMFRYSVAAFVDPRHAIALPVGISAQPTGGADSPPDSTAAADSTAAPDTSSVPDTSGVAADSGGEDDSATPPGASLPDTADSPSAGEPPDSGEVSPDSAGSAAGIGPAGASARDTTGVVVDTTGAAVDTTTTTPDTTVAAPGTTVTPPPTAAAPPMASRRASEERDEFGAGAPPARGLVSYRPGVLPWGADGQGALRFAERLAGATERACEPAPLS